VENIKKLDSLEKGQVSDTSRYIRFSCLLFLENYYTKENHITDTLTVKFIQNT